MSDIRVRVGQQNSVKVLSSISGSSGGRAYLAENVIGGIASVTSLHVSGISTFVGIGTFFGDLYVGGDLYVQDDLKFDEFTARNANITGITSSNALIVSGISSFLGISTFKNNVYISTESNLYFATYNNGGIAYFDSSGSLVSSAGTSSVVSETNYILTTDQYGIPVWSNVIDGGTY